MGRSKPEGLGVSRRIWRKLRESSTIAFLSDCGRGGVRTCYLNRVGEDYTEADWAMKSFQNLVQDFNPDPGFETASRIPREREREQSAVMPFPFPFRRV